MTSFAAAVVALLKDLIDTSRLLPTSTDWMPAEHLDRQQQYAIFRALAANQIGPLLADAEAGAKLRMYGDYGLIVETARDAVVGDEIGIEVPGAADEENPGAAARQHLLDGWAERERWTSKIYRGEADAAEVGDAVYELRGEGTRLKLRSHAPESFFPVWQDGEGAFTEAYLAWEEYNAAQYLEGDTSLSTEALHARDGAVVLYMRHYRKVPVDEATVRGATDREHVCVVTAGWYRIEVEEGQDAGLTALELLALEKNSEAEDIQDMDTGFDEIPLFYVPNRESNSQPWGLPEGDKILLLLLDAAQDQTDLKANTFMNAFPPLFDENEPKSRVQPGGETPATVDYKPGQIHNGRRLGVVDLSNGNKILLEHERYLIDKAMTNTRTTHIAAGLLKPGDIPSGVALMIAMMPLVQKTLPKRQGRYDKLGMLLKHVLRWHRAWGEVDELFSDSDFGQDGFTRGEGRWPAGIWDDERAIPRFGAILPIDRKQVSDIVRDLLGASAISTPTAVAMLQAAGLPIDDAQAEVQRIEEEMAPAAGTAGSGLGGPPIPIPGLTDGADAA